MSDLKKLCFEARTIGNKLDLTGCVYDPHRSGPKAAGTPLYYRFLAGLVKVLNARCVLEIGTHYGGSILAMARGSNPEDCQLITLDIVAYNAEAINKVPNIAQVLGDSTDPVIAQAVKDCIAKDRVPIDVMYIDSVHTYEAVKANMQAYADLRPKYIVLDDIKLNPSMEKLWVDLQEVAETHDLSEALCRKAGFGIIKPSC